MLSKEELSEQLSALTAKVGVKVRVRVWGLGLEELSELSSPPSPPRHRRQRAPNPIPNPIILTLTLALTLASTLTNQGIGHAGHRLHLLPRRRAKRAARLSRQGGTRWT